MEKTSLLPITSTLLLFFISPICADVTRGGCDGTCGGVTVPYPFGIGDRKCALSEDFLLTCNSSAAPTQLLYRDFPVTEISVEDGTLSVVIGAAKPCYNDTGLMEGYITGQNITLGDQLFRFSEHNRLTVVGCDTMALLTDSLDSFGGACVSLCGDVIAAVKDSRRISFTSNLTISASNGYCELSVPPGLKTLEFALDSLENHTWSSESNSCDYGFLADDRYFNLSGVTRSEFLGRNLTNSTAAIEWVVEEKTCEEGKSNLSFYACRDNSDCRYSKAGEGYRCFCKPGFRGNPYLGCQDINECNEPKKYPCHGSCKNTPAGNYTCSCPFGSRGDGKDSCQDFLRSTIAVTGGIILLFTIILLAVIRYKRRKRVKNFLINGGLLLKHQRVRIFKETELSKATKNYDATYFLGEGGFARVYKGILPDNTLVAIKKPKSSIDKASQTINQEFQHELAIVSQVNHINVVKVVGLCLETKLPLLVYEFIPNGTLFDHVHKQRSRELSTWKHRLRVAAEIAQALDYLHSLANPPIIHGDIKSTNILIDEDFRAKVSDFGASVLIHPNQSTAMVDKIQGTLGYLDPEYLVTGDLTPMSDVYSFGVVMVELLTGEKPYSRSSGKTGEKVNLIQCFLNSMGDMSLERMVGFGMIGEGEMEEIEAFAEVAWRCLSFSGVKRPAMKEVAEELGRLRKLNENGGWGSYRKGDKGGAETEHLLRKNGGGSCSSFGGSSEIWTGRTEELPAAETHSIVALDIESYEICR